MESSTSQFKAQAEAKPALVKRYGYLLDPDLANDQRFLSDLKLAAQGRTSNVMRIRRVQRLFSWDELIQLPPSDWLIPGLLPKGLSQLRGPSGTLKTFQALDWSLGLARQGKTVVYIAGEGYRGLAKRVRAWLTHHGLSKDAISGFRAWSGPVNLLDPEAIDRFVQEVRHALDGPQRRSRRH